MLDEFDHDSGGLDSSSEDEDAYYDDGPSATQRLRHGFGSHAVPALLEKLAAFEDRNKDVFYAPEFELHFTPETQERGAAFDAWFGGKPWRDGSSDLVHFGSGAAASPIALWMHSNRSIEEAPVVYMDSEGVGTSVMADNLREFLSLLATNRPFYGVRNGEPEFGEPSEDTAEHNARLREWLRDSFGIEAASDPIALVNAARAKHPDFNAWIRGVASDAPTTYG
jgi:hypothetical protein